MASGVIAEGILLVSAVVAVSLISVAVMGSLQDLGYAVSSDIKSENMKLKTEIVIAYISYNPRLGCFQVYLKNIGKVQLTYDKMTVFFGTVGKADLYQYNDVYLTNTTGFWTAQELENVNGVWDIGETLVLYISNSTDVSPPYYVKIVTDTGRTFEKIFSPVIT